jgi:hypothetical protein
MKTLKDKILERPKAFPLEPAPFLFELLKEVEPEKYYIVCNKYIEYLITCSKADVEFLTDVKDLLEPKNKVQRKK